jgi:hypothetical protein
MGDFLYICFMGMTEIRNTVLYLHTRKDDGKIFYVGIGSPDRANDFSNRGDWWKNVFHKHGAVVTVMVRSLTLQEACDLEIKMIAFYGRQIPNPKNKNYGCLINLTDGGEGGNGRIWTEEQKEYHKSLWTDEKKEEKRLSSLGVNNPMYGKSIFDVWYEKYDEVIASGMVEKYLESKRGYMLENNPHNDPEVRNKISQSLTGREFSKSHRDNLSIAMTGKKHSEERKQHQSVLSTGSKNGRSILTEDDVRYIKSHYKPYSKEFGMKQLAKMFGVSVPTIDLITRNKTWTEVV